MNSNKEGILEDEEKRKGEEEEKKERKYVTVVPQHKNLVCPNNKTEHPASPEQVGRGCCCCVVDDVIIIFTLKINCHGHYKV